MPDPKTFQFSGRHHALLCRQQNYPQCQTVSAIYRNLITTKLRELQPNEEANFKPNGISPQLLQHLFSKNLTNHIGNPHLKRSSHGPQKLSYSMWKVAFSVRDLYTRFSLFPVVSAATSQEKEREGLHVFILYHLTVKPLF